MSNKTLKIQNGKLAGLYENKSKINYSKNEELTFVDKFGTLTIPEKFRKIVNFHEYIQFRLEKRKLIVDPVNSDEEP